eukprot:TRINITY_DN5197_c0_g1_i12.p1 TRINITY_DN5197_c0_g1~~TRINITY_DN5197_c0_g1_i12.p1  ORF type:complete len:219 (+),score=91.36 TRINITY_DN5197_c0_g1_i12:49-705(+)
MTANGGVPTAAVNATASGSGDEQAAAVRMKIEEKVAEARRLKNEGNELYKAKDYRGAAGKYQRAKLYLKGIDTDLHGTPAFLQQLSVHPGQKNSIPKELEDQCIELNVSVHNNLCAVMLQQENANPERIKHFAEVVLEIDDTNEKAWFRKGQACKLLKEFDTAVDCFQKAVEFSKGKNKEAEKFIKECNVHLEGRKKKEKKMYEEMFKARSSDDPKEA